MTICLYKSIRWLDLGKLGTHCNPLQHTATHCNTLQHTATHVHNWSAASNIWTYCFTYNSYLQIYVYINADICTHKSAVSDVCTHAFMYDSCMYTYICCVWCMYIWIYTWLIQVEIPDVYTHDSIHICVHWSTHASLIRYMYTWFHTYVCAWFYTWLTNVETPDICTHDSIHICVKWSMYQSSDIYGHMILQMYVHMIVYMIDTRVDTRCMYTSFYTSSPCTSI